jgi:hypothetical protein
MKNLKYIQIFEAFESKILGKTLAYIKEPNDKSKFFDQIKRLCKNIDYPLSKMSDDYFEYFFSFIKKIIINKNMRKIIFKRR